MPGGLERAKEMYEKLHFSLSWRNQILRWKTAFGRISVEKLWTREREREKRRVYIVDSSLPKIALVYVLLYFLLFLCLSIVILLEYNARKSSRTWVTAGALSPHFKIYVICNRQITQYVYIIPRVIFCKNCNIRVDGSCSLGVRDNGQKIGKKNPTGESPDKWQLSICQNIKNWWKNIFSTARRTMTNL